MEGIDAVTLTISLRQFFRHVEDTLVFNFWPWTLGLVAGIFFGGVAYFLLVLILDVQHQLTKLEEEVRKLKTRNDRYQSRSNDCTDVGLKSDEHKKTDKKQL
jgi:hypothetical protein